ncbi:MAG: phosphatase PAP2 family protein [Candidatus Lloydbacteria bacterium]|nr:phosphatase PAP2 family protein [Candidatus Lloydbacteria bacterium]
MTTALSELGNWILSIDARVEHFFAAARDPFWTQFFSTVGLLGKWHIVLWILLAVSLALWLLDKRVFIIPLLISVSGAELLTGTLKNIIARPRPEMAKVVENSFAFPSGHATVAVALYGFLAYILFRMCRTRKEKIVVSAAAVFIILLIGFSRLYLGVHYVSDVIAGYLVGALWLSIGMCLTEHFLERKKQA